MDRIPPYRYTLGERYTVDSRYSRLKTTPEQEKTIEGCREAIDQSNARAVSLGYPAQQWAIMRHKWSRTYFANGIVSESEEKIVFAEIYPPLSSMKDGDILID